ncbi:uncharacterized protein LOC143858065 isoform X3 [Tasmannia lanceolata]|uniref:uncharacterized protein LOC143858065 isoform X3 n=1 Tax=Tasmannia lanceolata TaxID=3420 RepID=UPI0040644EC8
MASLGLFENAMGGKWDNVVEIYKTYPGDRAVKITRSGDTALHLAARDGMTDIVKKLMEKVCKEEDAREILTAKNERGDTPLHEAAALGIVEMCKCMVEKDMEAITVHNEEGETPLFLAVLNGNKNAFSYLFSRDVSKKISSYRRKDGNTILHCAIMNEYFDLAFMIINLYETLVHFRNEKGQTALHLLAENPSAYRSGCHLSPLEYVVYNFIRIHGLVHEPLPSGPEEQFPIEESGHLDQKRAFPENYTSCVYMFELCFRVLKNFGNFAIWNQRTQKPNVEDTENPREDGVSCDSKGKGGGDSHDGGGDSSGDRKRRSMKPNNQHRLFPPNYDTLRHFLKLCWHVSVFILGIGIWRIDLIKKKKQKHTWAVQVMEMLVDRAKEWAYTDDGRAPPEYPHTGVLPLPLTSDPEGEIKKEGPSNAATQYETTASTTLQKAKGETTTKGETAILTAAKIGVHEIVKKILEAFLVAIHDVDQDAAQGVTITKGETAILVAAKMGVHEIVKKILETFPVAIHDTDQDGKNIVLLAVENRQPNVYTLIDEIISKKKICKGSVFRKSDKRGNSALHLAATLGEARPWRIPGAALQMQWEIKWYKFVNESVPITRVNKDNKTPMEIFTETHEELVKEASQWLINTSNSCSVVAALIATVAFATAATVPGGVKQDSGIPVLEGKPAFNVFIICSLVALCFSVTSLTMFLSILTSRHQVKDFQQDLPLKLIIGLTGLFISVTAMLISFCGGHFFMLKEEVKYAAFPIYVVACVPIVFFAAVQWPLYLDLVKATFKKVPQPTCKVFAF